MEPVTNAKPRTWNPRRISAALHAAGLTYAALARQMGCSRPYVSQVANGRARGRRVAFAIAAAIGRQPWEIWPKLYAAPAPATPTDEPTTVATPPHALAS